MSLKENTLVVPEKPAYGVYLRLTPELKAALLQARGSGDAVSLRFRSGQANDVGVAGNGWAKKHRFAQHMLFSCIAHST